jgi:hypothetical protein
MTYAMARKLWDSYGTDRAYVLKLLGFSPFHCDAYAHCDWLSLPKTVRARIVKDGGLNRCDPKSSIHDSEA